MHYLIIITTVYWGLVYVSWDINYIEHVYQIVLTCM